MNRDRALGIGLRLLGLAFSIGPLLIALGMNDWNVQAALFDGSSLENFMGLLSGVAAQSMGTVRLDLATVEINQETSSVRVTLPVPSLPFSATVTEISLDARVGGAPVTLEMEEENVRTGPGVDTLIHLSGGFTSLPANDTLTVDNGSISFEVLGVSIETQIVTREGAR